jgi:hypothetical protein
VRIFENNCTARNIPLKREVLNAFIDKRYRESGKAFRRCHPRDLLTHAVNLIHFEKLPYQLTADILDRAFESCFVQEEAESTPVDAVLVKGAVKPCVEYWTERAEEMDTLFGKLAFLASFRDGTSGVYHDAAAAEDYSADELSQTLAEMHTAVFRNWLSMRLEQQSWDMAHYLSTPEGRAAFLSFDRRELTNILTPVQVKPEERQLFNNDLTTVMLSLSQRQPTEAAAPVQMERIA